MELKTKALALACGLTLAACETVPGQVTMVPQSGEGIVRGEALKGDIWVDRAGERYIGEYAFVEDYSDSTSTFGSASYKLPNGQPIISAAGSSMGSTSARTGNGQAYMEAPSGKLIRCQFRYSLAGNDSAIGACQDSDGRIYDLSIK